VLLLSALVLVAGLSQLLHVEISVECDQVLMMFVDFGDCAVVSVQDIRLLPTRFQQMPCVAVNVKLAGV